MDKMVLVHSTIKAVSADIADYAAENREKGRIVQLAQWKTLFSVGEAAFLPETKEGAVYCYGRWFDLKGNSMYEMVNHFCAHTLVE